jgi:catalase
MHGIPQHIIDRQLQHFTKADPEYGRSVAEKLQGLQG